MTCYRSRDNWHSYVKDNLNALELEELTTHLTRCPECRRLAAGIQETAVILASSRVILPPPASIKLNVMIAIDKNKYKKENTSHRFEVKNWGLSMVATGLLLLALNLTSLTPNFLSGQVGELNNQIGKQMAHPFDNMRQSAYAAVGKLEALMTSQQK